jgi:hypothetical protein
VKRVNSRIDKLLCFERHSIHGPTQDEGPHGLWARGDARHGAGPARGGPARADEVCDPKAPLTNMMSSSGRRGARLARREEGAYCEIFNR